MLDKTIKLTDGTDFPRRNSIQHFHPVEKALYEINSSIEAMGASTSLTNAVILVHQARNAVADHLEGVLGEPVKPQTWRDRLNAEEGELNDRITKLRDFLADGVASKSLTKELRGLMQAQLKAMQAYSATLAERQNLLNLAE